MSLEELSPSFLVWFDLFYFVLFLILFILSWFELVWFGLVWFSFVLIVFLGSILLFVCPFTPDGGSWDLIHAFNNYLRLCVWFVLEEIHRSQPCKSKCCTKRAKTAQLCYSLIISDKNTISAMINTELSLFYNSAD